MVTRSISIPGFAMLLLLLAAGCAREDVDLTSDLDEETQDSSYDANRQQGDFQPGMGNSPINTAQPNMGGNTGQPTNQPGPMNNPNIPVPNASSPGVPAPAGAGNGMAAGTAAPAGAASAPAGTGGGGLDGAALAGTWNFDNASVTSDNCATPVDINDGKVEITGSGSNLTVKMCMDGACNPSGKASGPLNGKKLKTNVKMSHQIQTCTVGVDSANDFVFDDETTGSGTITVNATFSGFCASERNCKRVYSLDLVKK